MLIILNNKCNLNKEEFDCYYDNLRSLVSCHQLVLCPSNIYLEKVNLSHISLGSQNVSGFGNGSYTGEISANQLKSLGVEYTIVGHSERRKYQKEDNHMINQKIKELLDQNITPILCVGETEEEKESNQTLNKIQKELEECLNGFSNKEKVIIAYEPIWAIGTGNTLTKKEIEDILLKIKENYPSNKLIYGGSVNEKNIEQLKDSTVMDGFLLGGLSLKIEELKLFLEKVEEV